MWFWHCELFVEQAWGTKDVFPTAATAARELRLHRGPVTEAPRGALIFFRSNRINQNEGHVGVSLGLGRMVSALAAVTITDVARDRYWRAQYLGWANVPITWPGQPAPLPRLRVTPGVAVTLTSPADDSTVSGTVDLTTIATHAVGVILRAYYAADPRDARTRSWHLLGHARREGTGWGFSWDTTLIPDQGRADWGTVRIQATAVAASGQETGNDALARYVVANVGAHSVPATPSSTQTFAETAGGTAHTWSDPTTAGGTQGPSIGAGQTVQISCKLQGFAVADGNTWWYRIASSPWNESMYVSADAFYNRPGQTSGSLVGTPFVDPAVPTCLADSTSAGGGSSATTPTTSSQTSTGYTETTGGAANSWTDYSTAGGTAGPGLSANQTVTVACAVQGYRVTDGNTWWYRLASSPWNGSFYASADAFYNRSGQTSGSLAGTPFVDPNVPPC